MKYIKKSKKKKIKKECTVFFFFLLMMQHTFFYIFLMTSPFIFKWNNSILIIKLPKSSPVKILPTHFWWFFFFEFCLLANKHTRYLINKTFTIFYCFFFLNYKIQDELLLSPLSWKFPFIIKDVPRPYKCPRYFESSMLSSKNICKKEIIISLWLQELIKEDLILHSGS